MSFRESKFEKFPMQQKEETEEVSKELENDYEKQEEYGKNVHEIITCMRHGPKEGIDTALSEKAEESIQKSVGDFSLAEDGIKIFTSESEPERCQETGKIISKLLKDYKREQRTVRPLTGLKESFTTEKEKESFKKVINSFLPENYEVLPLDKKKEAERQMENKIMVYFLEDDFPKLIERLEKEQRKTFPSKMEKFSHLEMASRFAEWVKLCINASKWLPSKTEINLINVSHEFNLMGFLKEAMIFEDETKAKDLKAKEFLRKIDGSIKPAEFFAIDVKRENKKNFDATLKFRDKNYKLDFSRIEELARLAKQIREKKKYLSKNNEKAIKG